MSDTTKPADTPLQAPPPTSQPLTPPPPMASAQPFAPPPQPMTIAYPPPPKAQGGFRRGFGLGAGAGVGLGTALGIASIISSLIFGLMMMGALAAAGTNTAVRQPLQTIWGSPTAPNTIRAVRIAGPILAGAEDGVALTAATYGYEVADVIDGLDAADAAGLLLIINTPGGTVNGSRAIADAVARYQERTGKKVAVHVQGMSASGGMYAMAGADEIMADHGSLIGSIGVIYGPFSRYRDVVAITGNAFESGVVTEGGITQEYLTQGRDKDFGNPFRDMTAEEREVMTTSMANLYNDFVAAVSTGRGIPEQTIRDDLGAHIFDPKTAIAKGLIDAELGIDEAYRRTAELAGVDPAQTRIVTATTPGLLEQLLGVERRVLGQAPALDATADPARVTASLCSATPTIRLYHGSLASFCG